MTAAIVAILLARQPHVASKVQIETQTVSTRMAPAHALERATPSGETASASTSRSQSASRTPLSRSSFSPSFSHAVPGRAASTPPDVPYLTPQPAAWIDLDLSHTVFDPGFDERILALARDIIEQTSEFPEAAKSPTTLNVGEASAGNHAEYSLPVPADSHPNWANAVAESDFRFRQFYGGRLWMQHHHHSHHLAAGNLPADD